MASSCYTVDMEWIVSQVLLILTADTFALKDLDAYSC